MNTVVLGLKAPLTQWCSGVVRDLVDQSASGTREIDVVNAAEFIRHVLGHPVPMVATISRPGRILREAIQSSGAHFVMSTTSSAGSLAYLARQAGSRPLDELRTVLDSASALAALPVSECGLRVEEDALAGAGPSWVARIAAHLRIECSAATAAEISGRIAARLAVSGGASAAPGTAEDASAREDAVAVQAAVSGMHNLLRDGSCDRIVATRRLFTVADTGQPPLGPIDATGRNRLLIHGPHLALPPGDWTARCVYGFSAGMVGTNLSAEVRAAGGGHEFARTSFNVTSAGRFDVNIRFAHSDPATHLEVRLFCDRAIFDGQVSVGFVEFKKNTIEPVTGDDLEGMIASEL